MVERDRCSRDLIHSLLLCFEIPNAPVGVDYVALESVSATFLPGGDNVVCVLVELLHDSVLEGNESFSVEITSVSQISGVVTGQLNSTTVVIRDSSGKLNEGKCKFLFLSYNVLLKKLFPLRVPPTL